MAAKGFLRTGLLLSLVLRGAMYSAGMQPTFAAEPASSQPMQIFLLAGQSNMAGRGDVVG